MITQAVIKEVAGFYNKRVVFNPMQPVSKDTKSFKLSEETIGSDTHIVYARINEFDEFIQIIKIEVMTVGSELFEILDPEKKGNGK